MNAECSALCLLAAWTMDGTENKIMVGMIECVSWAYV